MKNTPIKTEFYFVKINNTVALFSEFRVTFPPEELGGRSVYPFRYELRHGDEDWTVPVTIEKQVFVNHCGTLFSEKEIELDQGLTDGGSYADVGSFEYLTATEVA